MDPMSQSHDNTTLTICACDKLHLTYGAITLRFDPDDFLAFAASVGALASQFRQVVRTQHAAALSGAHGDLCH